MTNATNVADMLPFVLGALTLGMLATVSLVLSAYRVGKSSGESTARSIFAALVNSTRDELARARQEAIDERDRNEKLAAELAAERQDRERADRERREHASEAFNTKIELRRTRRSLETVHAEMADAWATIASLREQVESIGLAPVASVRDTIEEAPETMKSPRMEVRA